MYERQENLSFYQTLNAQVHIAVHIPIGGVIELMRQSCLNPTQEITILTT